MRKLPVLLLAIFVFIGVPINVYSGTPEKVIQWNTSTGHDHDGATDGKQIDSGDVIFDPAGTGLTATDVDSAITELDTNKIETSEKGIAGGVATLDGSAKILGAQLPAIAITDVYTCANEACQLALTVEEGDVCIRSDETLSYVHNGGTAGTMGDWSVLLTTGIVTSIQGEIGDVILDHSDLNNIGTGDHHAKSHAHNGADGSGAVAHSDTTGQTASDHHVKTISFGDLVDTASDAQIPNTITIDYSTATGDADTLDTKHYSDITGVITSDISTHTGIVSAHHSSTSDTYNITPATITTTGDMHVNSDSTGDQILFGTASDVSLYRVTTNQLMTDGDFIVGNFLYLDTTDTNLYRGAANQVKTDDSLFVGNFLLLGNADTNLYRSAANILKTDDSFLAVGNIKSNAYFQVDGGSVAALSAINSVGGAGGDFVTSTLSGDANYSFYIKNNGAMWWGPGSGAVDTDLYRVSAGLLQTDQDFKVAGGSIYLYTDVQLQRIGSNLLGLGSGDSWYATTAANYTTGTTTKTVTYKPAHARIGISGVGDAEIWGTPGQNIRVVTPGGGDHYALIPVDLPAGATVTQINSYGYSSATGTNSVRTTLYEGSVSTNTFTNMAQCTFSGGVDSCNDSSITSPIIAVNYGYTIELQLNASASQTGALFYGVTITYTTTDMSQTR